MKLVSGRTQAEASVSLNHTLNILEATRRGTGPHHILMAHCYITGSKFIATALDFWPKNLTTHKKVPTVSIFFLVYKRAIYEKVFFRQYQVFLCAFLNALN